MLKRLWHALVVGHTWREVSRVTFGGTKQIHGLMTNEDERRLCYGFTEFESVCACGSSKINRRTGLRNAAADEELKQLRKMTSE